MPICWSLEVDMTRQELTDKLLDIKREKGWTWKYIWEQIGGMSPVLVHRCHSRANEIHQTAGRQCGKAVRSFQIRGDLAQRGADARRRHCDAADRPANLPVLRAGHGQRTGVEGADRRGIR